MKISALADPGTCREKLGAPRRLLQTGTERAESKKYGNDFAKEVIKQTFIIPETHPKLFREKVRPW